MNPFASSSPLLLLPVSVVKPFFHEVSACLPPAACLLSRPSAQRWAVSATDVAMQQVPADIRAAFERRLDQAQVPADQRPDYHKWVRFYFDLMLLTEKGQTVDWNSS